jgi:hypothetical protein
MAYFLYAEEKMRFRLLAIVVAVAGFLPGLSSAQTVTGTNFELRGANGALTAQLTTSKEGTPGLFFFDSSGVPRISIGLYPDGAPGVVLNDAQGNAGALMRLVDTNGNPVVVLKENGRDKVIIDKNGVPQNSSTLMTLLAGFIAGIFGGIAGALLIKRSMP